MGLSILLENILASCSEMVIVRLMCLSYSVLSEGGWYLSILLKGISELLFPFLGRYWTCEEETNEEKDRYHTGYADDRGAICPF